MWIRTIQVSNISNLKGDHIGTQESDVLINTDWVTSFIDQGGNRAVLKYANDEGFAIRGDIDRLAVVLKAQTV